MLLVYMITMVATFKRENVSDCFQEAMPLLMEHWKEIAHYQDIPLEPDLSFYESAEKSGVLRTFTARGDEGKLIGYAVYFVRHNAHYKSSLQAVQDIIYIQKNKRGMGGRFILWCDEQLRAEGVQAVYHHVKTAHNFGPMLERFGYQLVDLIYARRLDK